MHAQLLITLNPKGIFLTLRLAVLETVSEMKKRKKIDSQQVFLSILTLFSLVSI